LVKKVLDQFILVSYKDFIQINPLEKWSPVKNLCVIKNIANIKNSLEKQIGSKVKYNLVRKLILDKTNVLKE
jgi:hypothetical protein